VLAHRRLVSRPAAEIFFTIWRARRRPVMIASPALQTDARVIFSVKEGIMAIIGTWKLSLETPFGVQTPSLRINADGTGGLISPIGEAPLNELVLEDDTAEFSASVPTPMGNFAIGFSVKASGDALAGTFTSPLGATDFTGVREV
jgi:hypothetical protein